jgi:hypothetical protein
MSSYEEQVGSTYLEPRRFADWNLFCFKEDSQKRALLGTSYIKVLDVLHRSENQCRQMIYSVSVIDQVPN